MSSRALRGVAAVLLVGLAAACIVLAVAHGAAGGELSAASLGISALYSSLAIASFALALAAAGGGDLRSSLALGRGRLAAGPVAVVAIGTVGVSHIAERIIRAMGLVEGSVLEMLEAALRDASGAGLALSLLGVGLAPAIGEELLFRGVLLRGIARRWGGPAALAISSLLFGAAHGDLAQGAGAVVLGLYLGAVALVSGSLWPAVLCHAANNLTGVLFAGSSPPPWVDLGALLAASAGSAILIRSR